jgi:peptidyl-prolyl cis-trans isomerase SurA
MQRSFIALTIFLGLTFASHAQDEAMERIIAVVGEEIVLKSDVDGQLAMLAQRDPSIDTKDSKLREAILDQLINERLIMTAATEDTTIEISDDMITQRMEMQISAMVQQFGSEKRIEDLYGLSMARIRREFRGEIRKQLLVDAMRQKKFANTKASRSDVEAFYAEFKDSIPMIPERLDLYHIVKYIKASDEQSKEAYDLALRVRDSIVKGGSFSEFARRYSGDPGSASQGGDLGFIEKGKLVPAFESAAFALQKSEISQPVETPFGWHIIQLIDKTGTSVNCRHILFKVGQSDKDREKARNQLNDLKQRALEGEDFEKLAGEFSEEKETQGYGGGLGEVDPTSLPPQLKSAVESLKDGEISEPMPYTANPQKPGFHIVYRKRTIPKHKASLDSDYKTIERMATVMKKQRLEQDWVIELRQKLYWEKR